MSRMPTLFVGHGSPLNALEKNPFTESLRNLGSTLPRPQAILSISAHWETEGTQILSHPAPPTIHDFYGFPQALFDLQYSAPGAPDLAKEVHRLLSGSQMTEKWGLDHGTWSVLIHMFPKADIPVLQVSLDVKKSPLQHQEVGQQLRALREQGVLILGSGNIVHNLRALQWKNPEGAHPWAAAFDDYIKKALEQRDDAALINYSQVGEIAQLSVPTPEHYLPLLYVFGASDGNDSLQYPFEGYQMGSLSMRSILWG